MSRGYLKFFKPLEWISMSMLFSTVGVVGLYEALSLFGERYVLPSKDGVNMAKNILQYIDDIAKKGSEKYGIPFNVEQIPAEGAAVTLAKADKVFHSRSPFQVYSNQSIPLWVDVDMITRARVDGELNGCYSGGGISHLNVGSPMTPHQNRKLIEFGIGCGLDHFATNLVFCKCENDHTSYGKAKRCSQCGGRIVLQETRVVGYFVPVSSWSDIRRNYEFPKRVWMDVPEQFCSKSKGDNGADHQDEVKVEISVPDEVVSAD
jgi:ribonucleoside-triphosphate reductase